MIEQFELFTPIRGNRYYSPSVIDQAIKTYKIKYVDTNRAIGQFGLPGQRGIDISQVSHRITAINKVGNSWIASAKILTSPMGLVAQAAINAGVKVSLRSSGVGECSGKDRNVSDLEIDGFHLVEDETE